MLMLEFMVEKEKAINSLLFLMGEANARGRKPSQYDLVKATFLADRAHLNQYGRPITFDRYVAMNHGPVPSFTYDLLKSSFNWKTVNRDAAPWASEPDGKVHRFQLTDVQADLKKLSQSDQQCLSDALTTVLSLTFSQVRKLTHEDKAYVAAWRDEENVHAFPINMALLLDEYDDEVVEELHYLAKVAAA